MQSKAKTVAQYLAGLPPDRRAALSAVRKAILDNLDRGFEEGIGYGMISYHVPHSLYPPGYHCNPKMPLPFAALASQKNYMSLYLMSAYGQGSEEAWLRARFAAAGKKLDMGKSCIRFKKLEDLPLDVIGAAIRRVRAREYVAHYERLLLTMNKGAAARRARGAVAKPAAKPGARAKA
jgi:hypothetical protein